MKALILCILSIMIFSGKNISAQEIDSDIYKIHLEVVKFLKEPGSKSLVSQKTVMDIFQTFNINEPLGLSDDPNQIWKKPEWKDFLSVVDTNTLENYMLQSNGVDWFKQPSKRSKRYSNIIFAPVILSKDNNKALSLLTKESKISNSGSYMAIYLEKERGCWKVKGIQTLGFFD